MICVKTLSFFLPFISFSNDDDYSGVTEFRSQCEFLLKCCLNGAQYTSSLFVFIPSIAIFCISFCLCHSSATRTILVQNCFALDKNISCSLPFSWRIKDYLEELWVYALQHEGKIAKYAKSVKNIHC